MSAPTPRPPRIEYLRVQNYRALQDIELKGLAPMTVFLGPNGSGKSTLFDVFAFLAESFQGGLRRAWDTRIKERLDTRELLAVNTLGQFARFPRVGALRHFVTGC